jgi:uncharacterized protein YecE (DUF72 family)
MRSGLAYIGCSGWQYKSWAGTFYPPALPLSKWLPYYTQRFGTVEVNNTFYRLPEASTFAAWRDATPPGFIVAVKASRYLTHLTRLRRPSQPLARLLTRAAALESRLGPILYQLPATLQFDLPRLNAFIRAAAAQEKRVSFARPLRHVVEFRHPSWYRDETFDALRRAGMTVCLHDMPGSAIDRTPDPRFVYVRFHGTTGKYSGSYSMTVLRRWAKYVNETCAAGRDAYAYFNNDIGGTAVRDAQALIRAVARGKK